VRGRETDTLLIERGKVRGAGDQNVSCRGIGSGRIGYDLQIFPGTSLEEAWIGGDLAANTLPAGQITGMVQDVRSVREIIEEMVRD